jgi:hypothetical protein
MRRFAFSRLLFGAALTLILSSITLAPAVAQEAQPEEPDSTLEESDAGETQPGRVKISIDESGISIEGRATIAEPEEGAEGDEWVEVYDERRRYKEKGLDIVKFGESYFVAKDELIRGDLVVFGGNAVVEGRVGGNVVVIGGDIRARSGAVIKGDAVVISGMLDEDEEVIIGGERVIVDDFFPGAWWPPIFLPEGRIFKTLFFPVFRFIELMLAFLVMLFLRDRVVRTEEHLADNFLKNFGVGLLAAFIAVFGVIIVSVTLVITIIGIPLAILLWISCAGVMVFAWTVFTFAVGKLAAKRMQIESDNAFLFVFIGAVIVNFPGIISWGLSVTLLPFLTPLVVTFSILSWFVRGFTYLSGFGALILSRFGSRPFTAAATPAPPAPQTVDAS